MYDTRRRAAAGFTAWLMMLAALTAGAVTAAPVAAQTTGTILGTVTDPGGLALPGATVTVESTETGQTRSAVTDGTGTYTIAALQAGLYQVTVTLSGFQTFQQNEFRLAAAQNARVDAQLGIGGLQEEIQVVADAVRVDTRSSSVSTNIDPQRVAELPMINRSMLSMLQLVPGIVEVTVPDAVINNDQSGSVVSGATGGRANQNDIQLDGAQMTTTLYNRPTNLPSPDAIQEFQVLTKGMSRSLLKVSGGSGDDYATYTASDLTSPSC